MEAARGDKTATHGVDFLIFKDAPNLYSKHVPSSEAKRWFSPQTRSQ